MITKFQKCLSFIFFIIKGYYSEEHLFKIAELRNSFEFFILIMHCVPKIYIETKNLYTFIPIGNTIALYRNIQI